jgi:hypothetical protein
MRTLALSVRPSSKGLMGRRKGPDQITRLLKGIDISEQSGVVTNLCKLMRFPPFLIGNHDDKSYAAVFRACRTLYRS